MEMMNIIKSVIFIVSTFLIISLVGCGGENEGACYWAGDMCSIGLSYEGDDGQALCEIYGGEWVDECPTGSDCVGV